MPEPAETPSEVEGALLGQIADEVAERLRRGETPDLADYARRHPHISRLIVEGLPLLEMIRHRPAASETEPARREPEQLGEFRIVRLIGRGGMAAVYEAEQAALGRNVALKVLSASVSADDSAVERFRREARAVALLHHTNIVPIFGVGEEAGANFFAMQFIHGRSLREAIDTAGAGGDPAADAPLGTPGTDAYWRNVSRLGLQLADALAHAHDKGVIHRDVKPSNVLVGADGNAWLTDFGLAKVRGLSELTRDGEVVGTLRFMAPECFRGEADARGDIYGLGMTLYELLTRRPAFHESDRGRLLWMVAQTEPPPPRSIAAAVPRDLETIVLKAIAKEPARRYQTAGELAEDLRRFLAGEPVRARRVGMWQRGVKWAKRRPAVAASLAVSAAAMLALFVGTLIHNAQLGAALDDARLAEREKTRQLAIAHVREAQARRNSGQVGRRFESLESLKKAVELFRGLGQLDEERTLELRNEAIACLTLVDLKPGKEWPRDPEWSAPLTFDPALRYYVVHSTADQHPEKSDLRQGQLSVRRVSDHHEVAPLPGFGVRCVATQFSPDGRYLAAHYEWGQRHNYVWDLSRAQVILKVPPGSHDSFAAFSTDSRLVALSRPDNSIGIYELPSGAKWRDLPPSLPVGRLHFHPDGHRLAVVSNSVVQLRELSDGKELATFKQPSTVACLAWRGDGKLLATGGGEHDHDVYLWDTANPAQPPRALKGHFGAVVNLAFSHAGDLLLSESWDSTERLWDPGSGQQLLSKPWDSYAHHFGPDDQSLDSGSQVATGRECRTFYGPKDLKCVAISPGGRLMASASADSVHLWDLAAASEGDKELARLPLGSGAQAHFDPKGQSLITDSKRMGLQRWPIALDPETEELRIGPPQILGLSARAPLLFPGYDPQFTLSSDGRTIAHSPQRGQVLVFALENPRRKLLIESSNLRHAAFSPDGGWLATGNWQGRGAKVWDARTGELAHELDLGELEEGAAWPTFSPDGKWLVTGTFAEYRFWEVGSWQKKHAVLREDASRSVGLIVFAPDSKMVALLHSVSGVRLVDPDTGREFARLPAAGCPYCFSPDGSQLITYAGRDGAIQVWDLRLIRSQLAAMGLDWDLPAYAPPSEIARPLRVQVLATEPLPPSKELDAQAYLERGLLCVELRQYPNALADFNRASTLDPKRPRWQEVVDAYSRVIERIPQEVEAYHLRAQARERLGRWEQAIDDYSQAIALAPQRPDLLIFRGINYLRMGHSDQAAQDFCKAIGEKSDLANDLARAFATLPDLLPREPRLAVELAQQATRQAPRQAMYWNTLGVAYYRSGDWEAAILALEESEKLEPGRYLGFNAFIVAMCHHQLGDPLAAKDNYSRAIRWCEQNQAKLSAQQQQELKAFRAEVEALLRAPPR
jgi:eukaryotic-like serine/threonine-protein kinase